MARPMKRANGTGAITKVTGRRRRKPYQVLVTIGWDNNGKQIRKSLGYFETIDKATIALANYNENPYDISGGKATFSEVYEKWSLQKFPTISESNINGIKAAYKRCEFLYQKRFKDIGIDDLRQDQPLLPRLKQFGATSPHPPLRRWQVPNQPPESDRLVLLHMPSMPGTI